MVVKLVGAAVIFLCGALYTRSERRGARAELEETEEALGFFLYIKNEISEYGAPLGEIFSRRGLTGGISGYLASLSPELSKFLADAKKLGRGYRSEELRLCDRLIARLEERRKEYSSRLAERTALSRVKAYGISAAIIILLL